MNGEIIRRLRKEKNITIKELAAKAEFTVGYISQIERNLVDPSISALEKLAKALNVSVGTFFTQQTESFVVRKNSRKSIFVNENTEIKLISPMLENLGFTPEIFVFERIIEPGNWSSLQFESGNYQKCIYVKKGKLLVEFEGYNEVLQEEDSIFIGSNVSHKCYNPDSVNAEILFFTSSMQIS